MMEIEDSTKDEKMGSSSNIRQCRSRTQSEPTKSYRYNKRRNKHHTQSSDQMNCSRDSDRLYSKGNDLKSASSKSCTGGFEEGSYNYCSQCERETKHLSRPICPHNTKKGNQRLKDMSNMDQNGIFLKNFSLDFSNNPSNLIEMHETSDGDSSCFPKLSCCRKTKRKTCLKMYENNNSTTYSGACVDGYTRLSSVSSFVSSVGTSSLQTVSTHCSNSSNNNSRTICSESSLGNLSRDSGFDEPPCLLNIIFHNHKCKGLSSCQKKDYMMLNLHLKALMSCMPQSFSEYEAMPYKLSNCSGVARDPYLSKRRNAICETSEEMRIKFNEALSSYLTLQAMVKYDFL